MNLIDKVKLSSSVTVKKYREMEKTQDRSGLSKFIDERLRERYITPLQTSRKKNGFALMACSCLLIETLEAFAKGWDSTDRKSESAFCNFFHREAGFKDFAANAHEFYRHVRCGILHQGETTGGWLITRSQKKPLLDGKTIHPTKFLTALSKSLGDYRGLLRSSDWESEPWRRFRKKMKAVIKNCE